MKQRENVYTGFLIIDSENELEYIQKMYGTITIKRLDFIFKNLFDEENNFKIMKDLLCDALSKCNQKIPWHLAYPYLEKITKKIKVRIDAKSVMFLSSSKFMTSDVPHVRAEIIKTFIEYIN
jgi:hypothetical protein